MELDDFEARHLSDKCHDPVVVRLQVRLLHHVDLCLLTGKRLEYPALLFQRFLYYFLNWLHHSFLEHLGSSLELLGLLHDSPLLHKLTFNSLDVRYHHLLLYDPGLSLESFLLLHDYSLTHDRLLDLLFMRLHHSFLLLNRLRLVLDLCRHLLLRLHHSFLNLLHVRLQHNPLLLDFLHLVLHHFARAANQFGVNVAIPISGLLRAKHLSDDFGASAGLQIAERLLQHGSCARLDGLEDVVPVAGDSAARLGTSFVLACFQALGYGRLARVVNDSACLQHASVYHV